MKKSLPTSNADQVARRLVQASLVAEIKYPGEGLAVLLDNMAALARNLGAEIRAAEVDWDSALAEFDSVDEAFLHETAGRQELVLGDAWAHQWMVMHLAKHLGQELERRCRASAIAGKFRSLCYEPDGTVSEWSAPRR